MAVDSLAEVLDRERVSYPDRKRLFLVLGLFLSNRISMSRAAELLGLRIDDFWLLLRELGVEYQVIDEEEVEEEVDTYRRIFKSSS